MPFLSEAVYGNLVAGVDSGAPESVHLASWPEHDPARIDEELNAAMRLVKRLASLGHAARNKAGRKVRQPLAEAAFAVGSAAEAAVVRQYADLLADELNVKRVAVLDQPESAVSYSLNPLPQKLGRKHGAAFPRVRAALLALDAAQVAPALMRGDPISVDVDGAPVEVLADEVEVRQAGREGFAVATEGGLLAALQTTLSDALVLEGLAREFVRRVQDLRKTANFDIADRIVTHFTASDRLARAVAEHADYIKGETLSLDLVAGELPEAAAQAEDAFDGETVRLGLVRRPRA
jgi:isoleucyl-tRNA synthetase